MYTLLHYMQAPMMDICQILLQKNIFINQNETFIKNTRRQNSILYEAFIWLKLFMTLI